jgi:hypothetical protein
VRAVAEARGLRPRAALARAGHQIICGECRKVPYLPIQ